MKRDRELELEAELELSLLQINQLQEELEHYYLECSRLKEQEAEYSSALLLTESRVNDSRYSESEFYEKGKSFQSQISQLKQALETSTKEKAELESSLSESQAALETSTKEKAELESSLSESQAALETSTKEKAELESSLSESQAALETSTKEKAELESSLSEIQAALESSTKEKAELESSLSETAMLEKQVSDIGAKRDREAHGHQENKKRAENLQCQVGQLVEQLTVDLKESSRSVVLGQKKLTKSQLDLDHLRNSYAEKVASEQELVELVNELREKLTLASRYYFDLQKEHPEILLPAKNI